MIIKVTMIIMIMKMMVMLKANICNLSSLEFPIFFAFPDSTRC